MDDLGNIVYLLFVLISIAAGLWKNFKKSKQERSVPVPEYDVDPVQPDPFEIEVDETAMEPIDAQSRLDDLKKAAEEAKADRRIRRKSKQMEVVDLDEESNTIDFDPRSFDPKKAIIYSEILNPPYL